MKFWNSGKGESNILQNQFTRYLKTAIQRRKIDVLRERKKFMVMSTMRIPGKRFLT